MAESASLEVSILPTIGCLWKKRAGDGATTWCASTALRSSVCVIALRSPGRACADRSCAWPASLAPSLAREGQPHGQAVRVLGQRFMRTQRQISRAYLHYLRRAQRRIFIANSYFVPDGRVLRALTGAARRGIDVRIIVAGQSDVDIVRHASRAVWGRLLRAGVRIFEWDESVLHAKSAVVDGIWSTTGTFNFDYLSLRSNLEVNVSVLDARFAGVLERSFLEDFEQCREVDLVDFRFRSLGQRLLEFIAYRLRKFL